jgi:hypothetical protein
MRIKKAIALKFTAPNGDTYFCSRPMVPIMDTKNNKFIFQILRNVDLAMLACIGDEIKVNVLLYPTNFKYNDIFTMSENNNLIYNSSIVKSMGIYTIPINIVEEEVIFDIKKGYVKQILNENPELKICLRSIYHKDIQSYEITHPNIEGDLSYLE